MIRKDGVIHQDFFTVIKYDNGKYHHNCKTIFLDYKLQNKLKSLQKKKVKLSIKPVESLRAYAFQSSIKSLKLKCIICDEVEEIINLHAAGDFHAT